MSDPKNTIIIRAFLVYVSTAILGALILIQIINIQFVENEKWINEAKQLTFRPDKVEAVRGNICADDGTLLVTSVPVFNIRMDVANSNISNKLFNDSVSALAKQFAYHFNNHSYSYYLNKLKKARKKGNRYLLLKRGITYRQLNIIKKFPILNRGKYRGGLLIETKTHRTKPYGDIASRTLGYSNKNTKNDVGIEGAYNNYLQGEHGERILQKTADGSWIPAEFTNQIEPKNGFDIITTIDVNIQDVAETSLREQLEKHAAHHGSAIVMEVHTGQIKAIANIGKDKNGNYNEIYNYAIGEASEPGSTFKLISYLAALEDGKLPDLNDTIDTGKGRKRFANRYMTDSHRGGYGKLSVSEIFVKSSNIGVSTIITEAYNDPKDFLSTIENFSLLKKLDLDIKGEGSPYFNSPDQTSWSAVSLPWMSIGYETLLTPLQILTFYNAVANDGKMIKPQFVKEVRNSGDIIKKFETQIINPSIASDKSIKIVQQLLENVVREGTARNLKSSVYKIAGKTGTAQIAQKSGGYNKSDYKASFAGYFPANNPQYSIIVTINQPTKGSYYGNQVSGTVFKDISDKIYATHIEIQDYEIKKVITSYPPLIAVAQRNDLENIYKNLGYHIDENSSEAEWVISTRIQDTVQFGIRKFKENIIPNVRGMGIKDAIYILEKLELNVTIYGKGKVRRQSIIPGTKATTGRKIVLHLS
ncbi:MAG: penicillin-binding protein [Bacteroidota bacterium]|nr:penicillin-binding protein [Bacteroidota bacterium]